MSHEAFFAWNKKVSQEDAFAARCILDAVAAVKRLQPIIEAREKERENAVKENRDTPWTPCEEFDIKNSKVPGIEMALIAIYELSQSYANAYAADMPEIDD